MSDAPCKASEAVERARKMVNIGGQYLLGTGDYTPEPGHTDDPWTKKNGEWGSDCAGFAVCYAWKLKRHRPGFNKGRWATIEDDINVNSTMEDSQHKRELTIGYVDQPFPGDLLCYPTFYIKGVKKPLIGHVALIEEVLPAYKPGRYDLLKLIQCHGPNHFKPGVVRTDGSGFMKHDWDWPKEAHKCHIVRMKERA